jgi:two-component system sensor histidine kinase PilS (NtrC family)
MKARRPARSKPASQPAQADSSFQTTQAGGHSWFGSLHPHDQTTGPAPPAPPRKKSHASPNDPVLDSGFILQEVHRVGRERTVERSAFERIFGLFRMARALIGLLLCLSLVGTTLLASVPGAPLLAITAFYTAYTLLGWMRPNRLAGHDADGDAPSRHPSLSRRQWLSMIMTDVASFTALHLFSPASNLNYLALLLLPVIMAGVLCTRRLALATAALVALLLVGLALFHSLQGGDWTSLMGQAGVFGCGLLLIALLESELASRLGREEATARDSLKLARQQARLNHLVIEEMQDGVLVVDRRGQVRAANPSARALLVPHGLATPAPFQLRGVPSWQALVFTVEDAFVEGGWPEEGRDAQLSFDDGSTRTVRVRIRFTRPSHLYTDMPQDEDFCVLLMEDVRSMQARNRQEKLAAMGRVSAGIAHEIRNPLSAIAQANALLSEDVLNEGQRKLTRMVQDNAQRIKRIVDDVMEVAPGLPPEPTRIPAGSLLAQVCREWLLAQALPEQDPETSVLSLDLPDPLPDSEVSFDPDHLRRILVNLLDNALRHSNRAAGCIRVRLLEHRDRLELVIGSNGAPISPEVERHLFEPFFSTRSRGTGLGLYICRELCQRYQASIDYRLRPPGERNRNEFVITLPLAALDHNTPIPPPPEPFLPEPMP